jgi:hypothetical protein
MLCKNLTTWKVLTSPWQPILIDNNIDGAAIDIPDLATVGITTPSMAWEICAWIFIISMEFDTGALLSLKFGTAEPFELRWSPTHLIVAQGATVVPTPFARVTEQWVMVFLQELPDHANVYVLGWLRGVPSPAVMQLTTPGAMTFPAYLKAPVGVGHFKVTYI